MIQGFEHSKAPDIKYETVIAPAPDTSAIAGSYKKAVCGSFAVVKTWKRYLRKDIIGLRFSCYVQPWLPEAGHHQVLMSTLDVENSSGFAIYLSSSGTLGFYVGTGSSVEQCDTEIRLRRWKWAELHISVLNDSLSIDVTHLEKLAETAPSPSHYSHRMSSPVQLDGEQPLTMAAGFFSDAKTPAPHASNMFNGRLDSPQIRITRDGLAQTTWAKFDFALDMSSDRIIDTSGNANHGDLINAPTRAVKGHNWDGSEPDWTKARYGYGAIHFHDDDLDDAAWATDFSFDVPKDALSGAYAVILESVDQSDQISDHVIFFVRPAALDGPAEDSGPKAAIVLSTFTYLAYANERMYDQKRASRISIADGRQMQKDVLWRRLVRRTDLGCSVYDDHNDGSGCVFTTAKRPILNIRPVYVNWAFNRPREFSADQLMIGFLEEKLGRGGYDVLTDHDLHKYGAAALHRYRVVVTGSHPEYPTLEVLNAYTAFARNGGHLLYLGGNGFYWHSVMDSNRPHRLEVRKGDQGCRSTELPAGERVHSLNGAQGGLWRSRGRTPQSLFGIGSCACGTGPGVPYRLEDHIKSSSSSWAWLLDGIEAETMKEGGKTVEGFLIGTEGFGGGASGDEIDRMDFRLGTPVNTVLLASSTGHDDSFGVFNEEIMFPMVDTLGTTCAKVRSDMTVYETCGGGSVFSVGSINWYCSLGWNKYDNNVASITWNVLKEFMRRGDGRSVY